jgi:hypothetical protein
MAMSSAQVGAGVVRILEGRVAEILNARELVINIGSDKGVTRRMKFAVLADAPKEVHDPETGELLDTVVKEKVRVEAVEVRPRITICRTYRTTTTRIIGGEYVDYFRRQHREESKETETLKAADASYLEPLSPQQSYVKINDRVVTVVD